MGYELGGLKFESWYNPRASFFSKTSRPALGPPSLLFKGTGLSWSGESGRGVMSTPYHHLVLTCGGMKRSLLRPLDDLWLRQPTIGRQQEGIREGDADV